MDRKKIIDIIGTVLLFLGLLLMFLPHTTHLALGFEEDHLQHIIAGFGILIVSLAILIRNNNAWRKFRK